MILDTNKISGITGRGWWGFPLGEIKMVQTWGHREGSHGLVSSCPEMRRSLCTKVEVKAVRKEKTLLLLVTSWNIYGGTVITITNYQRLKELQTLVELFTLHVLLSRSYIFIDFNEFSVYTFWWHYQKL